MTLEYDAYSSTHPFAQFGLKVEVEKGMDVC